MPEPPEAGFRSFVSAHPSAVFWVVAVILVVGVVVGTETGRTAIDTKPQLYLNPDATLASSLSAWQTLPALGQRSYESGLLLPSVISAALQGVGLPAWLVMRVLRIGLLLAGMAGAAWFARRIVGNDQPWAPRTAAVVYVLHPYVLVAGATLPVLWPWALLPWALGCVVLAIGTRRSWVVWTLAASLATMGMAGQNAGSVVLLQMAVSVPVLAWWSARRSGTGWRRPLAVLGVLGASVMALSAYWLLPGILATGSGAAVVAQTETGEAISAVSSWSEVVRGLGLWPLYGSDGTTPWVASHIALITGPVVVLAGFALLALAWWAVATAERTVLRLGVGLVAAAAIVMVGSHPWSDPPPLGRAWQAALEQVPALGVLRTTNKAGAALVIGVALLAALAVATAARPRRRAALIAVVAAVAVLPMWTGGLFVSRADVPRYWEDAVQVTDTAGSRLWLLPGQTNASYVWTDRRPDDVVQGLYDEREAMVRTTVANSSAEGATLLGGLDRRLQEGNLPPRALAAVSRYLGVGSMVVRNDVDNSSVGGAAPALVTQEVAGSEGLSAGPTFGFGSEGGPQVAVFEVDGAVGPVTAMDLSALVTVVGDASAVPDLAQLGILEGTQPFLLAGTLVDGAGAGLVGRSSKIVLTDTNLRAEAIPNRLTEDRGPALAADETAERMAGIWTPDDQSVRLQRGWRATASSEGSTFRALPWGAAENAVDGDLRTAWFAGDFGTAVGSELSVAVTVPTSGELRVRTTSPGDAEITGMELRVGDVERALTPGPDGVFVGSLPARSTEFSVRVTSVSPATSLANVGIAEITVAGRPAPVADVLRTPLTLTRLLDSLPAQERAQVTSRPLDVVLSRRLGVATSPVVEEPTLHRMVELPWEDTFEFRGLFRLGTPMPESSLDLMEGAAGDITATSSSQAFDLPTGRASMALDGDGGTAWLPAEPAIGEVWSAMFAKPAPTSEITLVQPTEGRQLTDVVLRVNGEDIEVALKPGRTTVELPEPTAVSELDITVSGVSEPATEPARLLEVEVGDQRIERSPQDPGCATVARVSGEPVMVRPAAPVTGQAFLGGPCGDPISLSAGPREWVSEEGFTSDLVVWSDEASSGAAAVEAAVTDLGNESPAPGRAPAPGWTGELPARSGEVFVIAGVGYDPAWRLTLDGGGELGPPVLMNGYAAGWVVPAGDAATIALSYRPQRTALVGLALSVLTLIGLVVFLVTRRRLMAADLTDPSGPGAGPDGLGTAVVPTALPTVTSGPTARRWRTRLSLAGWIILGGAVLGLAGVVASAAGLALRRLPPRTAAVALSVGWAVVAVAWFWGARDLLGSVTPALVAATSVANVLAGFVMVASVAWVFGRGEDER